MRALKAEVIAEEIKSCFSHRITYLLEGAALWISFCVDIIYTCLCIHNNKIDALLYSSSYLSLLHKLVISTGKRLYWIQWQWFSSQLARICKYVSCVKNKSKLKYILGLFYFFKHTRNQNLKHRVIKCTKLICKYVVWYPEVNWLWLCDVFAMAMDIETIFY